MGVSGFESVDKTSEGQERQPDWFDEIMTDPVRYMEYLMVFFGRNIMASVILPPSSRKVSGRRHLTFPARIRSISISCQRLLDIAHSRKRQSYSLISGM